MLTPRIFLASVWCASALLVLYIGIAHQATAAWWLLLVLVPPLIVFVWWMADRAALERRITRLEARSEIGYERRVVALTTVAKVEQAFLALEARVSALEDTRTDTEESETRQRELLTGHVGGSVTEVITINQK